MVIRKVFADDIKVSKMPGENLGDIRSYLLLYVKHAYIYADIIALVCYLWYMCNCFGFCGCGLSTERLVA